MSEILIIKKRKDFLRAATQGIRVAVPGIILQAARNLSAPVYRLGFTATKKIGKAHVRNRSKRRLRALAREIFPQMGRNGTDYILIGRYNTATLPFDKLRGGLKYAVEQINRELKSRGKANEKTADPAANPVD